MRGEGIYETGAFLVSIPLQLGRTVECGYVDGYIDGIDGTARAFPS